MLARVGNISRVPTLVSKLLRTTRKRRSWVFGTVTLYVGTIMGRVTLMVRRLNTRRIKRIIVTCGDGRKLLVMSEMRYPIVGIMSR